MLESDLFEVTESICFSMKEKHHYKYWHDVRYAFLNMSISTFYVLIYWNTFKTTPAVQILRVIRWSFRADRVLCMKPILSVISFFWLQANFVNRKTCFALIFYLGRRHWCWFWGALDADVMTTRNFDIFDERIITLKSICKAKWTKHWNLQLL
jgi:hypothetical protein